MALRAVFFIKKRGKKINVCANFFFVFLEYVRVVATLLKSCTTIRTVTYIQENFNAILH